MLILVINCGSSSAKYQLFDVTKDGDVSLAKGMVERIGQNRSNIKHENKNDIIKKNVICDNHYVAINIILEMLTDPGCGVIKSIKEIAGVGHRVVHGGEEFSASTLITSDVIRSIKKFSDIAPLHNPPALSGINACAKILKGVKQVAVFDTAFHQTMKSVSFLYGLPYRYYDKYRIRKYGFHGTSHRFVSQEAVRILKRPARDLKLITCHLGNGCSMAAVSGGKSVDTSMGFTPLEGLMMGTRSGDLDPAVVFFLMNKESLSPDRISDILNKESGLFGVSGISNDMRDILSCAKSSSRNADKAALALEMFLYRIKKYIGAYFAVLRGLDAVIFTAGIGENNPWLVERLKKELRGVVGKNVKFLVIPTNEELMIARDTYSIIKKPA